MFPRKKKAWPRVFEDFDDVEEFTPDWSGKNWIKSFRDHRSGVLISDSSFGGNIAIIPAKSFADLFPGAVCFSPWEVEYLLELNDHDARSLYELKKRMGGYLKIENRNGELCLLTN